MLNLSVIFYLEVGLMYSNFNFPENGLKNHLDLAIFRNFPNISGKFPEIS